MNVKLGVRFEVWFIDYGELSSDCLNGNQHSSRMGPTT